LANTFPSRNAVRSVTHKKPAAHSIKALFEQPVPHDGLDTQLEELQLEFARFVY
jgi:hypothetical protein